MFRMFSFGMHPDKYGKDNVLTAPRITIFRAPMKNIVSEFPDVIF